MTPEPFFAPLPQAHRHEEPLAPVYPDLPFQVPINVIGVPVALRRGLAHSRDTLVVLSHVVVYHRGIALVVESWVRPGTELDPTGRSWEALRPRFGVLLEDGTKVGHDPALTWSQAGEVGADGTVVPGLIQVGGSDGVLTTSTTWWLYPLPVGRTMDVVVAWEERGIPETRTSIDLTPMNSAARLAEPLWPLPDLADPTGWTTAGEVDGPVADDIPRPEVSPDPADPGLPPG